ncbi:MAG: hypothetical protein J6V80_07040 [Clostridia bacterium]|nr:hypothetical protein [Clostridia bacterium]
MKQLTKLMLLLVVLSMMAGMISCSASGFTDSDPSGGDFGGFLGGGPSLNGSTSSGKGDSGAGDGSPLTPDSAPTEDGAEGGVSDDAESDDSTEAVKPDENLKLPSGMITAGAWNDNDYYQMWLDLFSQDGDEKGKLHDYTNPDNSWGYNSQKRVKVYVSNDENPVAGAEVVAYDEQGEPLYKAVTDAQGNAYLFPDALSGTVSVTSGSDTVTAGFTSDERSISVEIASAYDKLNIIEIMLVVDVTGSMGDEIGFLKAELADVVNRIVENDGDTVIKLAMLFYRDTDDKVPFDYYDFTDVTNTSGLTTQQSALNAQGASGGGDYPEAVDEALNIAVNKQWSTGVTTKIIFHVLDAPAHEKTENKEKLVSATKIAAEKGIRICPIICSGAAEVTEYTMREAAIYTGGTFIFVTDDSGIGGAHHDPDIPNVTVELLNSMMVRLVKGYHTGTFDDPIYWKQDPNLHQ